LKQETNILKKMIDIKFKDNEDYRAVLYTVNGNELRYTFFVNYLADYAKDNDLIDQWNYVDTKDEQQVLKFAENNGIEVTRQILTCKQENVYQHMKKWVDLIHDYNLKK